MTSSNKRKIVPYPIHNPTTSLSDHANDLDIFKGKSFLEFNELIGLPEKNNREYPIFDYELETIKAIEQHKNIWIKKASGIGATTLLLRYLTWKILVNNDLEYKNIFIVSGTHVRHANDVKVKMEDLFRKRFPLMKLESKFTDLWIKNTNIKIFPSRNVKDLRGYTDVAYLFIDEADYFESSVNSELLHAITRYEEKSNCTTIMVSTPNKPDGLFQSIEKDPNSKYHKIVLLYDVGLDKIYDRAEIKKKMQEPEFQREYNGMYLGRIGNLLSPQQVDHCLKLGKEYSIDKIPVSLYTLKACGVDFGFSSSGTSIVCLEHMTNQYKEGKIKQDIIRVTDCYLLEKSTPDEVIETCWNLHKKYGFMNVWFFCDASNAGMINQMKIRWNENLYWKKVEDVTTHNNKIIPVAFQNTHKQMLSHLHLMASGGYLAVDPKHDKLITSLRTAYAAELSLDKTQTSYDDLLDGLRMALTPYKFK
jgi:hypothetical protein